MLKYIFALICINCAGQPIDLEYRDKIVNAIYLAEGGNNTKYPFGIKSINTGGDYNKAKKICQNTIINNWRRYQALTSADKSKYHCFLDFLGSKYCPESIDPIGHKNWIKNIHLLIKP